MSSWPSTRAPRVLAALLRIGWSIKRQSGSHRVLTRENSPDFVFAFHDVEEIGPRMLARLAKRTGLTPRDLRCPIVKQVVRSEVTWDLAVSAGRVVSPHSDVLRPHRLNETVKLTRAGGPAFAEQHGPRSLPQMR